MIFAEVYEVHSSRAGFYTQDFPYDALGFADVLAGLTDRQTIGSPE
ncbi:MAG: hypothetical protein WBC78_24175 [Candidatus Sulfotelmatobacter sp.]